MILMGSFIVDSTYTLFQRILKGEKIYVAHRNHAYQHAVQLGWSHSQVTTSILAINIFWLIPMAWWSICQPQISIVILGIAWLPLIIGVILLKAGREIR